MIMTNMKATRRGFLTKITGIGAAMALGARTALSLSAGEAAEPALQGTSTPLPPGIKSVQGSWVGTLTGGPGTTGAGLATFTSNGGLVTTNHSDTLTTQPKGGGHGV